MAKMALGNTLLSFVAILFLVVCFLEAPEGQGIGVKNRAQTQNQDEIMILLKHLEERYVTH